ncbi:MAG TPA: exodeoxyribonuclease VII large subunit [Candidatus Paceibacterota bacterium]|nr:exodeoxyribonuclease VII large subunit [Candidatus Paceibacterota bacterium]
MDRELYLKISKWREKTAARERMPAYRILSTQAVEGIASSFPETKEELLAVKGIAEKKFAKYGEEILSMVREHRGTEVPQDDLFSESGDEDGEQPDGISKKEEKFFSVGDYLELLNIGLRRSGAKVKGEISSLDIRERYIFFGLKDAEDGAMMSCFMWRNDYELSGVALEEGMEVFATGFPEIYKPAGRLSFRVQFVELFGEGALKKAYDELRKKLEKEGLFAEETKKPIPDYSERIGVITSKTGAVIHDFLNNIGKFGYHTFFYDSRVEGQQAVRDLVRGVKFFQKKNDIDVLIVMRGGGSLESLQAFNNEILVREVKKCPFPVIAAIGHDKDVPLLSLAADVMVSTPTAATKVLDRSWKEALLRTRFSEQKIFGAFREVLQSKRYEISELGGVLQKCIGVILEKMRRAERVFEISSGKFRYALEQVGKTLEERQKNIFRNFTMALQNAEKDLLPQAQAIVRTFSRTIRQKEKALQDLEKTLRLHSPKRQLKLGYSIVRSGGKILRSVKNVTAGQKIDITVVDGTFQSSVEKIKPPAQ